MNELGEYTDDLKAQVAEMQKVGDFLREWIPGGPRKRRRYRTPGHGKRKGIRRRQNKVARVARRAQRRRK